MPPEPKYSLPFLTRDMLTFENGLTFALRVDMQSDTLATLALRGMTREATFEYKATTASNSLITSATFALSDIPIFVTIEDSGRAFVQGSCFITISLLANGVVVQQLISGYVYAQKALSWPNTQQVDLRPAGGRLQTKSITDPSAGNIAEIVVPQGEIWLVRCVSFNLVSSAAAATRRAYLEFDDGQGGFYSAPADITQIASLTRAYSFAPYGTSPANLASIDLAAGLPPNLLLPAGGLMDIKVENIQAGDNINAPAITIEKFFTTP